MATRIKTVEYNLPSRNTSLTAATRFDSGTTTVVLEAGTKTFRSVVLRVNARDTVTTATSGTSPILGIKIDAVAVSDTTLGNPPGNTGESVNYVFERDVTSYFTTNYTGSSHAVSYAFQLSGVATINICAKLIITYEYDDTQATQFKTVRIPIESTAGALTATLAAVGTNQIPALDTFLPESTKTYRAIWIEAIYNDQCVGTTNDAALGIAVGGGSEQLTGVQESGLGSACAGFYNFDQGATPAWSTGSAQALTARSTNITTAATYNHVGFVLHVTYSFSVSNSTTIINSLMLMLPPIHTAGATTTQDQSEQSIDFYIEEPGTITQVQSGALVWYSQAAAVGPNVRLGAQATRAYTDVATVNCGATFLTQRTDTSGAQGSAWTLARGKNVLEWGVYIGTAGTTPGGFGAILYLNYTSDKSALGPGAHNQSLVFSVQDSQASGNISTIAAKQPIYIPETHWFRNNFAFLSNNVTGATNSPSNAVALEVESATGELTEGGWETEGILYYTTESEVGWYPSGINITAQSKGDWDRWDNDPETARLSLTASRRWKIITLVAGTRPLLLMLTKHSIEFTVSGTVSGSSGGTVNLAVLKASDRELLETTTRVGNGTYTFTIHDNTENVFVEARESGTLIGRSDNGTATGSP